MRIDIVGKNGFVVSKPVEDYLRKRLAKPIDIFSPELILSVKVVLKQYPGKNKVEVTMPCKGITIRAEASDPDMYRAIDMTADKLVTQVRKHKTKLRDHFKRQGAKDIYSPEFSQEEEMLAQEQLSKKLVKRKMFHLLPLTVNEALLEMEMMGHDFYVFLNRETNQINVCYIRKDGNYALIETKY